MKKIVAPPAARVYHGVYPAGPDGDETRVSPESLKAYLGAVGVQHVAWVYFSQEWSRCRTFPAREVEWIHRAGAAPYIRLMLRSSTEQFVCEPLFTLQQIAAGVFDDDLERWGKAAAAVGVPLICEWGTEMNGAWFPWNATHNGGAAGPGRFKEAYRRVVNTIRDSGGRDVTWVFHVNHDNFPAVEWNTIPSYDPGADVTDWIGLSLYGAQLPTDTDVPVFSRRYGEVRDQLLQLPGGRPVMICEFGHTRTVADPTGADAARWARDALESILSGKWPEVRGFSWWNEGWENGGGVPPTQMRVQEVTPLREVFRLLVKGNPRLVEAPLVAGGPQEGVLNPTPGRAGVVPKGPRGRAGRVAGQPWWSDRIDALFAPWSAQHGMPGAAVRVIEHGKVIHRGHYGLADLARKVPIDSKTSFLLASLTKSFTALAIQMLVEQGRLGYDHRLSEFFPAFPGYARDVSIRHLLQHTSGLREYSDLFIQEKKISPPDDEKDPWPRSAGSAPSAWEPTAQEALTVLTRHDLEFPPGEQRVYSNSGYVVLAQIVETLTGRSYPDVLSQWIFHRIGMWDSVVPVRDWRHVPRRANSYSWSQGKYRDVDYTPLNLVYGEDGIYATIEDMVRWDQVLYTADLVKQSTLDGAFRPGHLNNGTEIDSGYGWFIGPDFVDHAGLWLGFRTYIRRYRSRRLAIIVLANCAELNAATMGNEIANILLGG